MGFQFPLATVLRLREIAEEREERALTKILNEMAQTQQNIVALQARRVGAIEQREQGLLTQMSAAEMHLADADLHLLQLREKEAREHLKKLEELRREQMKRYEEEHRKRELLAGMRQDQLDDYRRDQGRKEQSMMDDNFSARRARA